MSKQFDINRYLLLLLVILAILVVTPMYIRGFTFELIPTIGAIVALLFCSALAAFARGKVSKSTSMTVAVLYLILACIHPSSLIFSRIHLAAMATSSILILNSILLEREGGVDLACIIGVLLTCAALCFPPFIWLTPLMIGIDITASEDKARFVVSLIAGALLPLIPLAAYLYFAYGMQGALDIGKQALNAAVEIRFLCNFSVVSILRIVVITVLAVCGFTSLLRSGSTLGVLQFKNLFRIYLILLSYVIIIALFSGNQHALFVPVVAMPLALALADFFGGTLTSRNGAFAIAFVCIAIIFERLTLLINIV